MVDDDRRAELRRRLWNDSWESDISSDTARSQPFDSAVLEQYKIYVEMADRASQRRGLANTYFLSLNTAIVALIGLSAETAFTVQTWWLLTPLIAMLGQCFAWYYVVRSYRQLNTAKYEVVGALEERLPASPYGRAEWWALGQGKDPARYWPLSHVEQWIPVLFGVTYLAGFIAAMTA